MRKSGSQFERSLELQSWEEIQNKFMIKNGSITLFNRLSQSPIEVQGNLSETEKINQVCLQHTHFGVSQNIFKKDQEHFGNALPPTNPDQSRQMDSQNSETQSNSDLLKNFLPTMKRTIYKLKGRQLLQIQDPIIQTFFSNLNKSSKLEFENLFKNSQARRILSLLFLNRQLERQLLLSVTYKKGIRKAYLNKLALLKKSFLSKSLNHL